MNKKQKADRPASKRVGESSPVQLENSDGGSHRSKMEKKEVSSKKKKEVKFAQLPRSSIKLCAESAGYPKLSDAIAALLAEDSNYRLTEVIFSACQFMRHAHRETLTTEDVSKALKWADVPAVYGHKDIAPVSGKKLNKNSTLARKEEYVDLLKLAKTDTMYEVSTVPSWNTQWLAIREFPTRDINSEQWHLEMGNLSSDLQHYYDYIVNIILNSDCSMFETVVRDLRSNSNIGPLLPFLVTFLHNAIQVKKEGNEQMSKMIISLDSLISNKCLYFSHKHYSEILVDTLFQCFKMIETDSYTVMQSISEMNAPSNNWHTSIDEWSLLELIAEVLVKVNKQVTSTTIISSRIFENLKQLLHDGTKPLVCRYGAICAAMAFGPMTTLDLLYPYIRENIKPLNQRLSNNFSSTYEQAALQRIYNSLLTAAVTLTNFIANAADAVQVEKLLNKFGNLSYDKLGLCVYQEFYEYFGDAFTARLPGFECESIYSAHGIAPLFSNEETKTASKILEDFYSQDVSDSLSSEQHAENSSNEKQAVWSSVAKKELVLSFRKKVSSSPGPKDSSQSPAHSTSSQSVAKKPKKVRKYAVPKAVFYRKLLSGNINNIL